MALSQAHMPWAAESQPRRSGKLDVPEWNGAPAGWQRYKREVQWFTRGTKRDERQYVVSRLLPGLAGTARETVLRWPAQDFEREGGAEDFLKRLSETPMVRRPLPDANVALDRYLGDLRRRPGETIASFLARESSVHEEFHEALDRLVQEQRQQRQQQRGRQSTLDPGGAEAATAGEDERQIFLDILRGWRAVAERGL